MIMKTRSFIPALMAALALSSCYHEKDITAEIGKPQYVIEDSEDSVGHFIYEFYQNYGVYILYDYSELDYRWNLNSTELLNEDYNFIRQKDKAALSLGIEYLEKTLFQFYNDGFKQKYFPIKILLADTIINGSYSSGNKDDIAFTGRNYLAIGRIRQDLENLSDEELKERRGIIHGKLWANNIYTNGLIEIPQEFFEPGLEYYGKSLGKDADPRAFGFWSTTGYANTAPTQNQDIDDFVRMITSHTQAEMEAEMADYELLRNKYEILLNYLNTQYHIDLQSIGNQ